MTLRTNWAALAFIGLVGCSNGSGHPQGSADLAMAENVLDAATVEDMAKAPHDASMAGDMASAPGCTPIATWPGVNAAAFYDDDYGTTVVTSQSQTAEPYDELRIEDWHFESTYPRTVTLTSADTYSACDVCPVFRSHVVSGVEDASFFAQAGSVTLTQSDEASPGHVVGSFSDLKLVEWDLDFDEAVPNGRCYLLNSGTFDKTWAAAPCDPFTLALGVNGGPSTCAYGEVCTITSTCAPAPVGECKQASNAPLWDEPGMEAPVIISATATALATTDAATECANGDPAALVTLTFYAPDNLTTHTTFSDLQMHAKFRSSTLTTTYFGVNFQRMAPPANAQYGTMQVGIACGHASGTAAIYIADEGGLTSNAVCVTW